MGRALRDSRDPRGPKFADLYRAGQTYQQIGKAHGISRERVRQLLESHLAPDERRPCGHRPNAAAERQAQALFEELMRRLATAKQCVACPALNLRGAARITCSPECADAWRDGRVRLSPEQYHRHRIHQARTYLANPQRYGRFLEWARKMLSDNPPAPNRRWEHADSRATALASRLNPERTS